MCLSTGTPPFPEAVANAVCGPQVPGTVAPSSGTDISTMNPCPLNACCDVWGQCGTTSEFCTPSGTGAPGTAKPGTNGCISNCGTDIVNNGEGPVTWMSIAYFEGFNGDRPCLRMDVSQVDKTKYNTIHFAFATLTSDFKVDISKVHDQFLRFTQLTGILKILSIGGWGFSTSPSTYMIFRDAMKTEGSRQTLANNIASFAKTYAIDGIDIDWEYPAAPDIPGIPSADPLEGSNYYRFLELLRLAMPDRSLSIAAPASFWYLKGFPIMKISHIVDYIIFMTYDLHGKLQTR